MPNQLICSSQLGATKAKITVEDTLVASGQIAAIGGGYFGSNGGLGLKPNTPLIVHGDVINDVSTARVWGTKSGIVVPGNLTHGKIHLSNNTVRPAGYVFEPDYKLASLSEVEAYTKANQHLPEVPSASEMSNSGVDLAAINMVLLKNAEELTLHAIALQNALLADQQKA